MHMALVLSGILLAFFSVFSAIYGSILAAPLAPEYVEKVRKLTGMLGPYLRSQRKLMGYLAEDVEKHGGISGDRAEPSLELLTNLQGVADALEGSDEQIADCLDFTSDYARIGTARCWLAASAFSAAFSAACQIISWVAVGCK